MRNRARYTLAALAVAGLALTGCSSKTVDPAATGATPVGGTGALWWFCDGGHAIYFSNYGYEDDFEFMVYGDPRCPQPEGVTADPEARDIPGDDE